jgi:large subunit ribosomal protein L15
MIVARGGKRGKTAGRGGKGQSARAGNKRRPQWRDTIKKLPKLRGRGTSPLKPFAVKPAVINLALIDQVFSAKDPVNPVSLAEKGLIHTQSGKMPRVKILGGGDLTKALEFSAVTASASAKAKIEKAGGTLALSPSSPTKAKAEKKA